VSWTNSESFRQTKRINEHPAIGTLLGKSCQENRTDVDIYAVRFLFYCVCHQAWEREHRRGRGHGSFPAERAPGEPAREIQGREPREAVH
jgi:hypothetical protein